MKTSYKFIILSILMHFNCLGQGLNHNFLIGFGASMDTNTISNKAVLGFDVNSATVTPDSFAMSFSGAQANISDNNGKLLMYTNGCYIADATGNMMQNGDSLNPGSFASNWCQIGLPIPNTSVFLPWPGDSTKYILFHQTSTDLDPQLSSQLFYTIVDLTLNGGLGAVTQKNVIALQNDSLCPEIAACKHANGRDWWIVVMSASTDTIYTLLLTPNGIMNMPPQSSGFSPPYDEAGRSIQFSPDGSKLAYSINYYNGSVTQFKLRLLHFDRCTGIFSNHKAVGFTATTGGYCLAFSPNSKYAYFGTFTTLFQVNTDTSNMAASMDTIAIKDNYCYPYNWTCPDFWYGYLAANGKIYISSGGQAIDFHYINSPDSDGIACDMHLHGLRVPCYYGRENVYHPNYYLGPVLGSACDTLAHVGFYELTQVNNVTLHPNPTHNGSFRVSYLLPQNKNGILLITDMMGKEAYKINLPQWSTLQDLSLPWLTD